jgi:ABC-type transporter Mla MlaB component
MKPTVPYLHTAILPPHQEAAVMFANGRTEEARALLEAQLATEARSDAQLWALLFCLHRIEGDWTEFDALAVRFRAQFQRPAPAWLDADALGHLPAPLQPGGDACIQLAGALDVRAAVRLEEARDKAARHASLHLDLSRIEGIDADGAAALSGLIRFLASNGNALLLTGSRGIIELLRLAVSGDGRLSAYWTLLLDLYQLEGRRVEFERAAVEYALCTGAPVPEWEAVVMPLAPRNEVREQRDEPRYQAGPEVMVLARADEDALLAVREFAGGRRYVNIDLTELRRVSPAAAAGLVELANDLADAHLVRLLRPNPLVEALLETLDLDARVQLIRAKSL